MKEKVLKEIEHELEKNNHILEKTDNIKEKNSIELHLMALGQVMALNNIKYSILNDNWLYKGGINNGQ